MVAQCIPFGEGEVTLELGPALAVHFRETVLTSSDCFPLQGLEFRDLWEVPPGARAPSQPPSRPYSRDQDSLPTMLSLSILMGMDHAANVHMTRPHGRSRGTQLG